MSGSHLKGDDEAQANGQELPVEQGVAPVSIAEGFVPVEGPPWQISVKGWGQGLATIAGDGGPPLTCTWYGCRARKRVGSKPG